MGEGREAMAVRTSLAVIFPRTDLGQLSVVLISIIQLELEVQYEAPCTAADVEAIVRSYPY